MFVNIIIFRSDQWEKASEFPEALTSVACCSLRLPNTTLQELTRDKYKISTMETDSLEEVHTWKLNLQFLLFNHSFYPYSKDRVTFGEFFSASW